MLLSPLCLNRRSAHFSKPLVSGLCRLARATAKRREKLKTEFRELRKSSTTLLEGARASLSNLDAVNLDADLKAAT